MIESNNGGYGFIEHINTCQKSDLLIYKQIILVDAVQEGAIGNVKSVLFTIRFVLYQLIACIEDIMKYTQQPSESGHNNNIFCLKINKYLSWIKFYFWIPKEEAGSYFM